MDSISSFCLDRWISAGYCICRLSERGPSRDPRLLPSRILSVSPWICDTAPGEWAVAWAEEVDNRAERAGRFGISEALLPEVIRWVTSRIDRDEIGWPHVFFSLQDAREFAAKFLSCFAGMALIGVGLRGDLVGEFLEQTKPAPVEGEQGVRAALKLARKLDGSGCLRGFDVLGDDKGLYSWLCENMESEVATVLGIRPNEHGLISSEQEATAVIGYLNQDTIETEPVWWLPWVVVQYHFTPKT